MSDSSFTNSVRIGYARTSTHVQNHQMQLDALAAADCREVIVETASARGERPKLRAFLVRSKLATRWSAPRWFGWVASLILSHFMTGFGCCSRALGFFAAMPAAT